MNKDLFKKALALVDAISVKIGLAVNSALLCFVYSALTVSNREYRHSLMEATVKHFIESKLAKMIDVTVDTLDHFDKLFAAGFHHTEVYLGRDGVYAYLARRAQLWVRRRAGLKVPRIIYLVYNSTMRSTLTKEQALPYLAQFGLTPDNQDGVLYYDTGFRGSIPIKIMEHLGLGHSAIIEKYMMVSYSLDYSDVRNIPIPTVMRNYKKDYWSEGVLRDEFCNMLEDLDKSEHTALGIETTAGGRITHVAIRVEGDSLRMFKLIRKILVQYFYTREKNALDGTKKGFVLTEPFPTKKVDIVVSKHCKLCDNHYPPEQESEHNNTCYDCYGDYCGDHHHTCCTLCGQDHCVNSYSHNQNCTACGTAYCYGNHYVLYCNTHDQSYCDSHWSGSCKCLVAETTIDTSLAAVFAHDWATISKAVKVI